MSVVERRRMLDAREKDRIDNLDAEKFLIAFKKTLGDFGGDGIPIHFLMDIDDIDGMYLCQNFLRDLAKNAGIILESDEQWK